MRIKLTLFLATWIVFSIPAVIGQNYWQQRVDYRMEINMDVKNHTFNGQQVLNYTNNSPDTLVKVFYHLYFNAFQPNSLMDVRSRWIEDPDGRVRDRIFYLKEDEIGYHQIKSLTQNDTPLTFEVQGTVLEVNLESPILPGQTTTFSMDFESQVPVQIRRSGRDNREGISYSMAQWFPKIAEYDRKGWHAHPYVAREFYSPWGDYEVTITIDQDFMIAATGILQNPEEIGYGYGDEGKKGKKSKDKKLRWKFRAENVHDFVWTADPDYVHAKIQVPDGPELHFFYQDDTLSEVWEQLPEFTVKAFQYIQENFGEYPYSKYSVIQGGDGGMEYPMATLITGHRSLGSLVGVTVHEVLHTWYQMLLATNESYYAWMDEGFTSYASQLTMAHLFGRDPKRELQSSYAGYYQLARSGKEEPLSTHSDHYQTNFAYGRGAYSKGAVSLGLLGYIIGEENLKRGLLRYFNEWKFKHPDLNDFIRVMEKTAGLELDWYYEYWVNSTHAIDYAVGRVIKTDASTTISLQKIGAIPMPIDLEVTLKSGEKKRYYIPLDLMRGEKPLPPDFAVAADWPWAFPSYNLLIDVPLEDIASIQIDPSLTMADINRENNTWTTN